MNSALRNILGLDARSLSAFRIGLGSLLLVDLAIRASDLVAHYTDDGLLSRELVDRYYGAAWRWSLHSLHGEAGWQIILFAVAAGAALCLLFGYRTRLATVASWVLLISVQTRNPLINNAGDSLIRMLLFWSMFLPLGATWSFDARRRIKQGKFSLDCLLGWNRPAYSVLSVGTAAIVLQLCVMYWATGCFKWNDSWRSGAAMGEIFAFDSYARPMASWFLEHPDLGRWISWWTLALEFVGPLLLFIPWRTAWFRLVAIVAFVSLHLGIELTLTVGLFSWASILAWSVLLPACFWDSLARHASFFRRNDSLSSDQTESKSESESATELEPLTESAPESHPPHSEIPHTLCSQTKGHRNASLAWQSIAAIVLAYVLASNTLTVLPRTKDPKDQPAMPTALVRAGQVFAVHQKWTMFQRPSRYDGWYVILARLDDGRNVDLMRGGAEADWNSWDKPESIVAQSKNHRWRKYRRGLRIKTNKLRRREYCEYLVRQWDKEHPNGPRINQLELCYMQEVPGSDSFTQRNLHVFRGDEVATPDYLLLPIEDDTDESDGETDSEKQNELNLEIESEDL